MANFKRSNNSIEINIPIQLLAIFKQGLFYVDYQINENSSFNNEEREYDPVRFLLEKIKVIRSLVREIIA